MFFFGVEVKLKMGSYLQPGEATLYKFSSKTDTFLSFPKTEFVVAMLFEWV